MGSFGKLFLAALIRDGRLASLLECGEIEHLFGPGEVELHQFLVGFAQQYHKLPEAETFLAHTGIELPEASEPVSYYLDLLRIRHLEVGIKKAMKEAAAHLQVEGKDPTAAFRVLAEAVTALSLDQHLHQLSDFRRAYRAVIGDYVAKYLDETAQGVPLGWPTLDAMTGGLVRGDLVSVVGRPERGKTQFLLYAAHHAWKRLGVPVVFVSMEMKPLTIQQRLAALQAHVPMTWLKNAALTSDALGKVKAALLDAKEHPVPFWVVDGNFAATVDEIWMLARQLHPGAIFVDGAYLLKHARERDRYRRVAENADLIKQLLSDVAPTVCSWQFAKSAAKKPKGENPGLEDIGYTDAIAQVSSLVLGMLDQQTPATVRTRTVEILKGRGGETGRFTTHWDWVGMNFGEVPPADPAELLVV